MSVRRETRRNPRNGKKREIMIADMTILFPDGTKERRREMVPVSNKRLAEQWERQRREELLRDWEQRKYGAETEEKEVPTFEEWWSGRFWREWVVAERNKPSEVESKESIYKVHLEAYFGALRLDATDSGVIAEFRARLVEKGLSPKRINNVLAPLSKALRYAEAVGVIERAPRIGFLKVEAPEIEWWEFEQYARLLRAAREEGEEWLVACALAGEAGLRIGEVRALVWERDLDLVAGTLTVKEQTRKGVTGSPKGRRRRTVPMTPYLLSVLKALSVVRRGLVARNADGGPLRDGQTTHAVYRICRRAGLPERGWHTLRHSFGTHAAMLGVNPWRLNAWLGHRTMSQTMSYVHVAEEHRREMPGEIIEAAAGEVDPDRRLLALLGARSVLGHGNNTATPGSRIGNRAS